MRSLARVLTALAPLALTPILLFAIADGYLNFGGGEKDLLLLLPWVLWALVFAVAAFVLWWRRWPHGRALVGAGLAGVAAVVVAAGLLVAAELTGTVPR